MFSEFSFRQMGYDSVVDELIDVVQDIRYKFGLEDKVLVRYIDRLIGVLKNDYSFDEGSYIKFKKNVDALVSNISYRVSGIPDAKKYIKRMKSAMSDLFS